MKFNSKNKLYLESKLTNDLDYKKLLEESKLKIRNCFSNFKINVRKSKKIISDFEKLNPTIELRLKIIYFYLEFGIKYGENNDMYSQFYDSFENMFEKFIMLLNENKDFIDSYKYKLQKLIEKSQPGYGHQDILFELFDKLK